MHATCAYRQARKNQPRRYARRGEYRKWMRASSIEELLEDLKQKEFKTSLRMNRSSFDQVLHLSKDDDVFKSKGRKPQLPVHYQLGIYLIRYGSNLACKISGDLKIGEGSVYKCCKRVARALRKLKPRYVRWPTDEEKWKIKLDYQEEGFPGAIGSVDGTYIQLLDRPRVRPMAYLCRKKIWALNMMGIVDPDGRFIFYDLGWPGSTSDVTVWKRSHIWRHRDSYLAPDEWLFADKGYNLSRYLITPFSEDDRQDADAATARRMKKWNKAMASRRIIVEHAFGRLKSRFRWLQGARGFNLDTIYRAIESMIVLHNILIDFGDLPEDIGPSEAAEIMHLQAEARDPIGVEAFQETLPDGRSARHTLLVGKERRRQLLAYWVEKKGA